MRLRSETANHCNYGAVVPAIRSLLSDSASRGLSSRRWWPLMGFTTCRARVDAKPSPSLLRSAAAGLRASTLEAETGVNGDTTARGRTASSAAPGVSAAPRLTCGLRPADGGDPTSPRESELGEPAASR